MDNNRTERVYSRWAAVYDRAFGRIFQDSREALVRSLNADEGARVLEIGVGTGLCLPLYPRHCQVTAIDLSPAMLEQAANKVAAHALTNVRLAQMDAGNMEFPDSTFDIVVAAYVVTAVPDYRAVMREIVRVCRPGGRVLLLNHFTQEAPVIAALEKMISPICVRIGFRTDLSTTDVINGWPLAMQREERVKPLGFWRVVECVNRKS